MDDGFMVPLVFFAFLAAIIIVPQVLRSRDRQRMYETMRAAYEKGQPVPPQFVEAMTRPLPGRELESAAVFSRPPAERDLRRGVVWTAVGVGLILIGVISAAADWGVSWSDGRTDALATCAVLGAVPLCIGLAFLALWFFSSRKSAA